MKTLLVGLVAFRIVAQGEVETDVWVRIEKRILHEWQPVPANDGLRSGDRVRFRFFTPRAGFLLVFNRASDGRGKWLFPKTGNGRVEAGSELLLPSPVSRYVLNGPPGEERLFFVLTNNPITNFREELDRWLQLSSPEASTLERRCPDGPIEARCLTRPSHASPPGMPGAAESGGAVLYEVRIPHLR